MSTGTKRVRHSDASRVHSCQRRMRHNVRERQRRAPGCRTVCGPARVATRTSSEGRNVPPVTEPVKSLGVSLAEDEKGRGAAELQVGDARYLLDRDQVDYLIHTLIRMRRSIQHHDAAPQS